MEKYTIYCTEAQTKKALELGAPIRFKTLCHYDLQDGKFIPYPDLDIDINGEPILIPPTADQMIGWLRTNGLRFKINESEDMTTWQIKDGWKYHGECATPKEAILSAIDAALDYLSKSKK